MKKKLRVWALLLLLLLPVTAAAQQRVFDNAQVFSAAEEKEIAAAVDAFIEETGMDFAVLTVDQALNGMTEHDLVREYYLSLGIGLGDDSSGALYVLNFNTANRAETLYVDGQLMYYITDERQEQVQDQTNPLLVNGDYSTAALTAIQLVQAYVEKGIPEGQYVYNEETGMLVTKPYKIITSSEMLIGAGVCLLIGLLFVLTVNSRYKLKGSTYRYDYNDNTDVTITDSDDTYLRTTVTRTRRAQPPNGNGGGMGGGGRTTMSGGGGSSSSRGF